MYSYSIVLVTHNRLNLLKESLTRAIDQTISPVGVYIVDNASTDGTGEYLDNIAETNPTIHVIKSNENIGGAGGFSLGLKSAYESSADWFMLIDDDAILDLDCMENLDPATSSFKSDAYACTVASHGKIDLNHRRFYRFASTEEMYRGEFRCDLASFCGLMVSRKMVSEVGYPEQDYFIWFDDTEYCMRFTGEAPIVVRPSAVLDHKTQIATKSLEPSLSWKNYYGFRNQINAFIRHRRLIDLLRLLHHLLPDCFMPTSSFDSKYCVELCRDALFDGVMGHLGKNEKYLPLRS